MRRIVLAAALMALSAAGLDAQNPAVSSRTGTATIVIPTLLHIDVTNLTVSFPSPTFDDFTAGSIAASSGGSVIDTRGNVIHDVTIEAATANMSGPAAKPASDLQWSTDGSAWTGLSLTAADVATAVARGSNANVATVLYQMLLNETNDVPGTYSLDFIYTVVPN
ncbi:MAG: hypothetical protein GWM90_18885 [Gemmatimonadetes bacterium]|nr:hypothetical protein [Gemmatimonadota bacterium]NIQ56451.1 hypothetical protein [Gemmatimonadota bacterium]NIU76640.1 hypothetical protein [Gammaproteobacteria bacterium]NIX46080.1 hypothetical protein [Gemmatimonadota bacterium]NIY10403.1 hypothetical protein [Gemmatimonadota bacterium]